MSREAFELLGLPVQQTSLDELEKAYLDARQTWYFRQYSPEFMLEAKDKLEAIEEAYLSLKSPHQQAAILKAARGEIRQTSRDEGPAVQKTEPRPARMVVNRPLLVRSLVQSAEKVAAENARPLHDEEIEAIALSALRQGMEWSDAREIADKIAEKVASKFPPSQRILRRASR